MAVVAIAAFRLMPTTGIASIVAAETVNHAAASGKALTSPRVPRLAPGCFRQSHTVRNTALPRIRATQPRYAAPVRYAMGDAHAMSAGIAADESDGRRSHRRRGPE